MTQEPIRALLLIDHPAQHFTRALQAPAHEPARTFTCSTGRPLKGATIRVSAGLSPGTLTCSADISGRRRRRSAR